MIIPEATIDYSYEHGMDCRTTASPRRGTRCFPCFYGSQGALEVAESTMGNHAGTLPARFRVKQCASASRARRNWPRWLTSPPPRPRRLRTLVVPFRAGSHEIDLTTCKPVDVLLPYYSKLSVSSQKWVFFFSVMKRRIELALRDYSQALQIDSERIRSVFRTACYGELTCRALLGRDHQRQR